MFLAHPTTDGTHDNGRHDNNDGDDGSRILTNRSADSPMTINQRTTTTTGSRGGGTGQYAETDGDFPRALANQHEHTTAIETSKQDHINILHKNVRGLNSDERLDELWTELGATDWDVMTLNETWRPIDREYWEASEKHHKHVFMGSGYAKSSRGVGILVMVIENI